MTSTDSPAERPDDVRPVTGSLLSSALAVMVAIALIIHVSPPTAEGSPATVPRQERPTGEASPRDEPRRGIAEGVREGGWFTTLTKYAAAVGTSFLVVAIMVGVLNTGYVIEDIEVPEELTKVGLDGRAVASLIRDRTATLMSRSRAGTGPEVQFRTSQLDGGEIDLKIGGTDLPIRAVVTELTKAFRVTQPKITGTIWRLPSGTSADRENGQAKVDAIDRQRYRLVLRGGEDAGQALIEAEGALDDLLAQASVAVLGDIDPSSAANYLRTTGTNGQTLALSMALRGVRRARTNGISAWSRAKSWLGLGSLPHDLPIALAAEASVLSTMGRYEEAVRSFGESGREYAAVGDPKAEDLMADGQGYAAIQHAERESSAEAFDADLRTAERVLSGPAGRGYDSSLFHMTEVGRHRFDRALRDEGCGARTAFDEANARFVQFERQHEEFVIAKLEHAIMLKTLSGFLQFQGARSRPCVGGKGFGDVAALQSEADRLLEDAVAMDPSSGLAWLEWGILTYERQISTPEWHTDLSAPQQAAVVETAIWRMSRAAELDPGYAYAHRRVADAVKARLALPGARTDEREHQAELRRLGFEAACRGLRLASDDSRPDLLALAVDLRPMPTASCLAVTP